ncbi:DUF512 domain-containing protein [Ruminococcaceae bacterium OttesenSCG-928-D13]|nr:DUF512 domain-containing protein [Ruminococcaceae bacterium OttesenSCG-928-D13]
MPVTIKSVAQGSPAEAAGLRGGMRLCSVNGHPVDDGLDYEFHTAASSLVLAALDGDKQLFFRVEKDEYQPLGCEFESYLITGQHRCINSCVFCFIDQLPAGMRESLYFKDDDERLGFLFGNYITLTNLTERELARIIEMRFSPVNISVHTVNPELRVQMMGNRHAGEALGAIPKLAAAGIAMNFQLVLVPGMNDGEELRRSIRWLAGFAPQTESIAAVPVGLTRHRQGLPELAAYTEQTAAEQLDLMLAEGERLLKETGSRVFYPSDEFYLLAKRPLPDEDFYEGYPQLENGVGLWRLLREEFAAALEEYEGEDGSDIAVDIATGVLAAPLLEELAGLLAEKFPGARVTVHTVENRFFGPGVTVAGLLTGGDIMEQLAGKLQSGRLLLVADMLRAEGDRLLDDTTPAEIGGALGAEVEVVPRGGEALLAALLGEGED